MFVLTVSADLHIFLRYKMIVFISIFLFLIFAFLSTLHFYWSLGGRWGSKAVFPTKDDSILPAMPGVVPTVVVALGLLLMGVFVLLQTGFFKISIPLWINNYGLWIIAGIFILRAIGDFNYLGFFKKIKHTKFGQNDTKYYSPLCLIIGILAVIIELNK